MSVSGEQVSKVVEGDVILESNGYVRMYMANAADDVWYEFTLSPRGHAWVGEPRGKPYIPTENKYMLNVKDLLIKVREEMREPSN